MQVNADILKQNWPERLKQQSRIQVLDFLHPESAQSLLNELDSIHQWDLAITTPEGPAKVPHKDLATMQPSVRGRMMEELRRQSRKGFSFAYYRRDVVPGEDTVIDSYRDWIQSEPFFELMRQITGDSTINYADAQATVYQTGSFLRAHDDTYTKSDGRQRRFAYVLNLTPEWKADWGGILNFQDEDGRISECLFPEFNSLSIFQVPQTHFVSQVTTYAKGKRTAVTGWLFS